MTLRELLNYIDFDAELENGKIKLIDKQGACLGNIAEERYRASEHSVSCIIDRLEVYWDDYVIKPLCEDICAEQSTDWRDLYDMAIEHYGKGDVDKNTILKYLISPSSVIIDEDLSLDNSGDVDELLELCEREVKALGFTYSTDVTHIKTSCTNFYYFTVRVLTDNYIAGIFSSKHALKGFVDGIVTALRLTPRKFPSFEEYVRNLQD